MPAGDAGLERQAIHEGMGPPYAVPREWLVQAERERDALRAQLAAQQAVVDAARATIDAPACILPWKSSGHESEAKGGCLLYRWHVLRAALSALDKTQAAQPEGEPR